MGSMRLAMHGDETYERQVRNLADQIELLEMPKQTDEEIIANWEDKIGELKAVMNRYRRKRGG